MVLQESSDYNELERRYSKMKSKGAAKIRITKRKIREIIPCIYVNSEGFGFIYQISEKLKDGRYDNYLEIVLDSGNRFNYIGNFINRDRKILDIESFDSGLREKNLYISDFCSMPSHLEIFGSDLNQRVILYGHGNVFSDKIISIIEDDAPNFN